MRSQKEYRQVIEKIDKRKKEENKKDNTDKVFKREGLKKKLSVLRLYYTIFLFRLYNCPLEENTL